MGRNCLTKEPTIKGFYNAAQNINSKDVSCSYKFPYLLIASIPQFAFTIFKLTQYSYHLHHIHFSTCMPPKAASNANMNSQINLGGGAGSGKTFSYQCDNQRLGLRPGIQHVAVSQAGTICEACKVKWCLLHSARVSLHVCFRSSLPGKELATSDTMIEFILHFIFSGHSFAWGGSI